VAEPAALRVVAPESQRARTAAAVENASPAKFQGFFSVILPAFNEEYIIEKTWKE
jgi:hypothetical protein